MSKIVDVGLIGLLGGALVVGSYQAGKFSERGWWRDQLAARSAAVAETVRRLGGEASDLDETVLRTIEGDRAKLEDAESTIRKLSEPPKNNVAPDAGAACRPVPAECLRRS